MQLVWFRCGSSPFPGGTMSVTQPILAGLCASCLLIGCSGSQTRAVSEPATPAAQIAVPVADSTARSRMYLDAATGQPRAPTATELATEAAQQTQSAGAAALRVQPGVEVTHLPNGVTEYNLGDAGQVKETTCLQHDGSLGACNPAQLAELQALAAAEKARSGKANPVTARPGGK